MAYSVTADTLPTEQVCAAEPRRRAADAFDRADPVSAAVAALNAQAGSLGAIIPLPRIRIRAAQSRATAERSGRVRLRGERGPGHRDAGHFLAAIDSGGGSLAPRIRGSKWLRQLPMRFPEQHLTTKRPANYWGFRVNTCCLQSSGSGFCATAFRTVSMPRNAVATRCATPGEPVGRPLMRCPERTL